MPSRAPALALLTFLLATQTSRANDSAAEIAAGGLVLKEERRIAMKSERLVVTRGTRTLRNGDGSPVQAPTYLVSVEYEFLNESAETIVTEVAFPEPDYYWHPIYGSQGPRWLRAWVDGKPIPVDHEVHALKGTERVDVTRRLRQLGASPLYLQCGSQDDEICDSVEEFEAAFRKLGTERYEALVKENLLVGGQFPGWGVRSTWHWRQSFPPGKIVRIRHEYVPEPGFALVQGQPPSDYPDRCFGPIVQARLDATTAGDATGSLTVDWVKYILLTANNWKRPIGRFELVVEHPRDRMPSFCWDGPIERTSPTAVRARAADFVPKHDLVVYFAPLPQ